MYGRKFSWRDLGDTIRRLHQVRSTPLISRFANRQTCYSPSRGIGRSGPCSSVIRFYAKRNLQSLRGSGATAGRCSQNSSAMGRCQSCLRLIPQPMWTLTCIATLQDAVLIYQKQWHRLNFANCDRSQGTRALEVNSANEAAMPCCICPSLNRNSDGSFRPARKVSRTRKQVSNTTY